MSEIEHECERWWDALPMVEEEPSANTRSLQGTRPRTIQRRPVLKGFAAVVGALSLGVVDAVTKIGLRAAGATVGTEFTNCTVYGNSTGYNNNTLVCVGFPYSYTYCGSDGWFKNSSSSTTRYTPLTICNGRNAWWWYHSNPNTSSSVATYRCADGTYSYLSGGRWVSQTRICSAWLSSSNTTR